MNVRIPGSATLIVRLAVTLRCLVYILVLVLGMRAAVAAPSAGVIELSNNQEAFLETSHTFYSVTADINPLLSVPEPTQLSEISAPTAELQHYWIHVALINRTHEQEWILDTSNALISRIIAHSISSSRHRISEQGYIKSWPFDLRYGTEIILPPNEITQLWVYIESPYGISRPLISILPQREYQEKSTGYSMQLLVALGALVMLAIYTIIIFVPTRDYAYLFAASTQLAATIAWGSQCKALLYGISIPMQWYWLYLPLFIALASQLQFTRHYLRIHYPHPLAYILDIGAAVTLIAGVVGAVLLQLYQYPQLLLKIACLVLLLSVFTGVWRRMEKHASTTYFLLASSLLVLASVFYLLDQSLQWRLVENGIQAAAWVQLTALVFFMLGLIDRMSVRQREIALQISHTGEDPVTGLPNRKAFERDVRAWEAYCNEGIIKDFFLSFFDIVGLQHINKTKGRKEGDRLLILVSKWLLEQTQQHVYRIGGNEILVLAQENITWDMLELERYLRQEGFRNIEINIGTSCFSESNGRSSLLKIADQRLHKQPIG